MIKAGKISKCNDPSIFEYKGQIVMAKGLSKKMLWNGLSNIAKRDQDIDFGL